MKCLMDYPGVYKWTVEEAAWTTVLIGTQSKDKVEENVIWVTQT